VLHEEWPLIGRERPLQPLWRPGGSCEMRRQESARRCILKAWSSVIALGELCGSAFEVLVDGNEIPC